MPGIGTRKKSIEGGEFTRLVKEAPRVTLRKVNGFYIPDPNGNIITSMWAAIGHGHFAYEWVDPSLILHLDQDTSRFFYGVGCGTDWMEDMSLDYISQAQLVINPYDNKIVMVIWSVNRHGVAWAVPWGLPIEGKDGKYHQGMEAALELLDPESYGAIGLVPDDIPQWPRGFWQ